MMHFNQWVLLFFLYSFCGWIWESCFVSVRKRQWVNRGFLHGPLLPIYGFGAIFILLVTLPARDNLVLVWILGVIAATVLEYITGAIMERLFKVRYWDYSNQKFNVNGHICLSSSIAWGFFSIFLVQFLHPLAERLLICIPTLLVEPIILVLIIGFTIDIVRSVQAALDLKQLLIKLTEENEELGRLAHKAELAKEELLLRREQAEEKWYLHQQNVEADLHRLQEKTQTHQQEQEEKLLRRWKATELDILDTISVALEKRLNRLEEDGGLNNAITDAKRIELQETLQRVQIRKVSVGELSIKRYKQYLRILRGNPSVRANEFQTALDALRKVMNVEQNTLDDDKSSHS